MLKIEFTEKDVMGRNHILVPMRNDRSILFHTEYFHYKLHIGRQSGDFREGHIFGVYTKVRILKCPSQLVEIDELYQIGLLNCPQ